jgi:anti-sigma factor RsiW
MSACDLQRADALDALVQGELTPAQEGPLRAHLQGCAGCARELAWLRAERVALKSRPAPPPAVVSLRAGARPAGLDAVRERARRLQARDRAAARRSLLLAGFAAAAALLVAVGGGARPPSLPALASEEAELASVIPWCGELAGDEVGRLESAFAACLIATPRALPGVTAICL